MGLRPRPHWGSSQRSPDYLAGYKCHEGDKNGGNGKRRDGKGKEDGGEGESDKVPPTFGQSDANGLAPLP